MSLLDRVERTQPPFVASLAQHGGRLAIVADGVELSYAQLAARVEDVADALGPARRLVVVSGSNELDAVVGYLAALRGGHPVLLAPGDGPPLDRLLATFEPDVVLGGAQAWTEHERVGRPHALHPDLALLLSTSGSTGSPRVVRLSHRNLQANAASIATYLRLAPDDRAITSLPMQYCYGLSVINSHLAAGAGLVLTNGSVVDPCFWDLVRQHSVTGFAGVPHTFDLLDRTGFEAMELPTLRYVTQAGGRLAPDRVRRYAELGRAAGWELFVMYGQTEATARMAYLPPALALAHPAAIGVPVPGGSLDLEQADDADDGVGELVYRGANVMLGYADGPEDLALGATVDALHTGDLARRTAEGLFEIVGRRSRFAKVFGLRLDLDHLQRLLADREIEALCASDDERLVIGVTTEADAAAAFVRAETGLPPSRVVVVALDVLPRLPNGKPDHRTLLRLGDDVPAEHPAANDEDCPPGVHPPVHRALTRVLGPVPMTAGATFVDLGGDSLSYVEVSVSLAEVLGDLPLDWHVMPIGELVPSERPRRRLHQIETSVLLRAVAIVMVVGTHIKLFTVLGGAHLLLGIAGYNFARFRGQPRDRVRSIARIAVPSILWLAIASTVNDRIHLPHLLLLHGWIGEDGAHGGYWYIEAIVQILVPLTLLLSVPSIRRLEQTHRATVPVALLGAGLLVRFGVVDLPTVEPHDIRPHDIFWIFALGWVMSESRTTAARLIVSATLLVAVPGYFGEPAREAFVVGGLLLLLWVPTVRLLRPAARVIAAIASASLYIYLTHWQVFPPLRDRLGPLVALAGSILGGIAAAWVARRLTHQLRRWRQPAAPAVPSG